MFASGKAPGYDNISKRVNKQINLSLQKGMFPDKLKIAKVIPIFTKHMILVILQTTDPLLCCPIFQNFLKKVMYNRMIEFTEQYN